MNLTQDEILYKGNRHIWYIIVFIIFCDWMLLYDQNSFLKTLQGLNKEIERLQKQKDFLKKEIEKDKQNLQGINTIRGKEKFGRENYYLKRDNEDIYIIEYDTIR